MSNLARARNFHNALHKLKSEFGVKSIRAGLDDGCIAVFGDGVCLMIDDSAAGEIIVPDGTKLHVYGDELKT
jgi:hypothetical protein